MNSGDSDHSDFRATPQSEVSSNLPETEQEQTTLFFSETQIDEVVAVIEDKSNPPKKRLDAILFLIDMFQGEYFDLLTKIIEDDDEHPDVRSAAALSMGKIGGDRALKVVLKHTQSKDLTLKNYSLQALGMLKREEGIEPLIEALKDEDNIVFASAAEALGKIGKPVVPHLMELLESGAEDARCVAAWQLGELRYVEAIPALIKIIPNDDNTDLVALCIWALGEIGYGTPEVIDVLEWGKKHESPDVHERARSAALKIARHVN